MPRTAPIPTLAACTALAAASVCSAQVITAEFAADYTLTDLGAIAGVPSSYGGLFILASDPGTLYIGGAANQAIGAIYAVPVTRDAVTGSITGFAGPGIFAAPAPNNDGGLTPDPSGLISSAQYPTNSYAQISLALSTVVHSVPLGPLGIGGSSSCVQFIPPGYPGAGGMRIASYPSGQYYHVGFTTGGGGGGIITPQSAVQVATLPGGPEGWAYIPLGSALVPNPSLILSEYAAGDVAIYELDANGDPVIASRRLFIDGLSGAEGAAIDPVTGDFLFSTFGGVGRVLVVAGFAAPSTCAGDLNADGFTNSADLNILLAGFGCSGGGGGAGCAGDIDDDGDTDSADLNILLGAFGCAP